MSDINVRPSKDVCRTYGAGGFLVLRTQGSRPGLTCFAPLALGE